jgi:hypothetical protein
LAKREILKEIEIRIVKKMTTPILTDGSETWTKTKK